MQNLFTSCRGVIALTVPFVPWVTRSLPSRPMARAGGLGAHRPGTSFVGAAIEKQVRGRNVVEAPDGLLWFGDWWWIGGLSV